MKGLRCAGFQTRFTLEGLNLERFLRLAAENDLPLLSVRRDGLRRMRCECYTADLTAFEALIADKGWRCAQVEPILLSAWAAALRRRWGLPLGAALMIAAVLVLQQFVWAIELTGAGAYRGDLLVFLQQQGVSVGMPKRMLDPAGLERGLYRRYPKLAWVSVTLQGVTLNVTCTPEAALPEAAPVAPGNIVASRDGLISAMETYAGTPAAKVGEIVRKGQVLIWGYEQAADGQTTEVPAEGRVLARCWVSRSATVSARETRSERTGRTQLGARLRTPWFAWPAEQTPSYLAFEREVSVRPVVGCFFPLWQEETCYHEVALAYAPRDAAAVRAEAAQAAYRRLSEAVSADETVDKWVDYCMIEGDSCTATATAETIVDIAQAADAPP